MDTRSGDLLSAALATTMSAYLLVGPNDSFLVKIMENVNALPEYAIIGLVCSVMCIISTFLKSLKFRTLCRFMSGCIWGSVLMAYASECQFVVMFWSAVVLFSFDIIAVLSQYKEHTSWTRKSLS